MLTVTIDQSEGISGANIPEQAVKKMRSGSAALSNMGTQLEVQKKDFGAVSQTELTRV